MTTGNDSKATDCIMFRAASPDSDTVGGICSDRQTLQPLKSTYCHVCLPHFPTAVNCTFNS